MKLNFLLAVFIIIPPLIYYHNYFSCEARFVRPSDSPVLPSSCCAHDAAINYITRGRGEIYSLARKWESLVGGGRGRRKRVLMLSYYLVALKLCRLLRISQRPRRPMELRRRHAGLIADEMYCHLIVNRFLPWAVINTALLSL